MSSKSYAHIMGAAMALNVITFGIGLVNNDHLVEAYSGILFVSCFAILLGLIKEK